MTRTPDYIDVPDEVLSSIRTICLRLPEAYEEPAWAGVRWRIRKRTFAHVLSVDEAPGPVTLMSFRAEAEDLEILHRVGHPFLRPRAGRGVVGMVISDTTDWQEVKELLTDSYRILAPKRLADLTGSPLAPRQN